MKNNPRQEQLMQIFRGCVWDGDLISKDDRDHLVKFGFVEKCAGGWNIITSKGIQVLHELGFIGSGREPKENMGVWFSRESEDVILFDGKHYRSMSDKETAEFIWRKENEEQ